MIGVDKKALRILFNFYPLKDNAIWNTKHINDPDFEYAKKQGVMFDPIYMTHRESIEWLLFIKPEVNRKKITDLFVASLSTRQLDWRSGLSAFAISQYFPDHDFDNDNTWGEAYFCDVCGDMVHENAYTRNLNLYNLNRLRSGGCFDQAKPVYLAFYLNEILKLSPQKPNDLDIQILDLILNCIQNSSLKSVIELEIALSKIPEFKSNKIERKALIETLGFCGILETVEHKGYYKKFIYASDAAHKPNRTGADKWAYPAVWWTGIDGVNMEAWDYWFGDYKLIYSNQ